MEPIDIQPLLDITKQVVFGLGKLLLDVLIVIWNALPGLPTEIKGVLIGLAFVALLFKISKSSNASYHIRNFMEKIANILNL